MDGYWLHTQTHTHTHTAHTHTVVWLRLDLI